MEEMLMLSPTHTLRGLSPVHPNRPAHAAPVAPSAPNPQDRAEMGSTLSRGLGVAAVLGLCLMAGSGIVHAQVIQTPQPPVQEQTLSEQLEEAAQKQGVQLQFTMIAEDEPAKPISPWHAELVLAEGGTVAVTESQADTPDRVAHLTDTRQLNDYIKYMRGDAAETPQQNGANVLRTFLKKSPTSQLLQPETLESLSPFSAAQRLAAEKPVTVSHKGIEQTLENLKDANQFTSFTSPGPGCDFFQNPDGNPGGVLCFGL